MIYKVVVVLAKNEFSKKKNKMPRDFFVAGGARPDWSLIYWLFIWSV